MSRNKIKKNPKAEIIREMTNPKWLYRTAKGIAIKVKLPEGEVIRILDSTPEIRKSLIPGKNGSSLYVLKSRKTALGDAWQAFRSISGAKVGSSEE
ncbi:hypothetical protein ELK40_11485 [Enterobacter sp. N18-03635]|uniref:hypothetical protein n=1 Tax=Enterobacter sp. N18-03635 TaxID=2500132 RepID=UPI000FD8AD47|nr:hypothetical protein [Enterobacter sp. N18-03635]AZV05722.1 hypothetical protein ELK40_11485 [Enterobacter sp. N18-03635]